MGKRGDYTARAALAAQAVERSGADRIVISGDVTDTGSRVEGRLFERIFARVLRRCVIVPGNHDRGTDDYAKRITRHRVWVHQAVPLYFICCDSTQPFNSAAMFMANGLLAEQDINDIVQAARAAPKDSLVSIVLHHHLFEARAESAPETVSDAFKLPFMAPVDGARQLLARIPPNVRLVLHGHKHQATVRRNVWGSQMTVYNGGSTTELGGFRVFEVGGAEVLSETWVQF